MEEDSKRKSVVDIVGKFENSNTKTSKDTKKQVPPKSQPKQASTPLVSANIDPSHGKVGSAGEDPYRSSSVELRHKKHVDFDRVKRQDSTTCRPSPITRSIRSIVNDQIDLLLIGKTGNGKSALGNSILDYNAFVCEPSSTSVTKEVSDDVNEVNGRIIKVVDSPGVGDTDWEDDETTNFVVEALSQAITINSKGYHAFLLVVRFGGRFTKEDKGTIDFLKKVFGQNFVRKFCILVMTYGDQFEAQVKVSFQDWIQSQKGVLSDLVKECNNRVILFDNQTTDRHKKQRQVNELIEIVDSLKHENSRYTNDQFDLAIAERESLELTSKAPLIIESAMTEANLIFKQFKRIQETLKANYDPAPLEPLLKRINTLYDSIRHKDNKTGVLGDLLVHLESMKFSISDEVKIFRRLSELEKDMRKKYVHHIETLSERLKDAKVNYDRLSHEKTKAEQYNIQKLEEEIQKLKKEKAELEKEKLDNFLEMNLITNKMPEIDLQNKTIKAKHRENVLASMFHKIAKTFTKKTKDRPPEQDEKEEATDHFLY